MKKETYFKHREEFLNQYSKGQKNELGFIKLKDFKIRAFDKFIFLFSCDFTDCNYNNTVNSLGIKQFLIKNDRPVTSIKINSKKSMFDRFQNTFENAIRFYYSR